MEHKDLKNKMLGLSRVHLELRSRMVGQMARIKSTEKKPKIFGFGSEQ